MRSLFLPAFLLMSGPALAQSPALWDIELPAADQTEEAGPLPVGEMADFAAPISLFPGLAAMRSGDQLTVPMPDGVPAQGTLISNVPTVTGGRYLQFELANGRGSVVIHSGLNSTFGRMWTGEEQYSIEPIAPGALILRTADDDYIPEDDGLEPEDFITFSRASANGPEAPSAGTDTLDFLYFYDFDMLDVYGWGVPDLAATDIGNLTTSLSNSGVPLMADLTQLQFMNVDIDYSSSALLTDAGNRSGVFSNVQTRVDNLGIDVISLNRPSATRPNRDDFCGLGYVHNPLSDFAGRSHINVCHNGLTLAHETGHNMGLAHGLETDGSSGRPEAWARGFRIDSSSADGGIFTSVMAYGSNRQTQFSDPTITCPERGSVCGIPLDPANSTVGSHATEALTRWATGFPSDGVPNTRLRSAVLPTSRYIATNSPATAFMTVINPSSVEGTNCIIEHHGPYRDSFTFQTTDPNTNQLTGTQNLAVNIPANGFQTFLVSITPSADITTTVRFAPYASCDNLPMALVAPGLNTIDLGADAAGGPDLVALSATLNSNGIVEVPGGRRGVFSVATLNLGGAGDVTVSALSLDPALPATGQVCQTDAGGACLAAPADSLTLNIGANESPTFGVFVRTNYVTPFSARQRFQFQMQVNGEVRGSTSVAVRDQGALVPPVVVGSSFSVTAYNEHQGNLASSATGYYDQFEIVAQPTGGTVSLNTSTGAYTYTAGGTAGSDQFTYRARNASGWSATMAASITINALQVPSLTAFNVEDDTEGTFTIDLDDHADGNIEIDRFVLTTPPSGTYSFNELTGVISGTLPDTVGAYGFTFTAENRSGQGTPVNGSFNVIAYDACAPTQSTPGRIARRLAQVDVTDTGTVTSDEIEVLATALCMEVYERTEGSFSRLRNPANGLDFAVQLVSNNTRYRFYINNTGGPAGWDYIFDMCKTAGQTRMATC